MLFSPSVSVRYRMGRRGPVAGLACRLIRALDRLGSAFLTSGEPMRFSVELTRRSLWNHLPHRPTGRPGTRRLLALSFDLDYQADTDALPALLRLAARLGAHMSIVAIGQLVEQDPAPYRTAVEAGHEIVNHTWSHPDNPVLAPDREFWHLTADEMQAEIEQAQDAFERHLGIRPVGFRSPHFKDAHRLLEVLASFEEMRYLSSALASKGPLRIPYFPLATAPAADWSLHYSGARPADNSNLLMIPLTPCPEHRWSPFCSYHAIRQPADPSRGAGLHTLSEFAGLWHHMLQRAWPDGFASVYFDPMDVMRDAPTAQHFEAMLRRAQEAGWTLTTLAEVERAWRGFGQRPEPATHEASSLV